MKSSANGIGDASEFIAISPGSELSAEGYSLQSASLDALLMVCAVVSIAVMGWRFTVRRLR